MKMATFARLNIGYSLSLMYLSGTRHEQIVPAQISFFTFPFQETPNKTKIDRNVKGDGRKVKEYLLLYETGHGFVKDHVINIRKIKIIKCFKFKTIHFMYNQMVFCCYYYLSKKSLSYLKTRL